MSAVSILMALALTCLVALALTCLGRDQGRRHLRRLQSTVSWDGTLSVTHYWDCNGQDCDSKTVPAIEDPDSPGTWVWQEQLFSASPLYAPVDPNDYGGPSDYGEKFWATGAANDDLATLLGADVASCGTSDLSPGGCGKCLLVQNDNAINADWKVMVMKKNRCPPYSPGCEAGKLHLDLAVPGFDDVRFSTGNVCQGNPNDWTRDNVFGMTHASSSSCALWWDGNDNTQAGCDCTSVTSDYGLRAGCELFTQWGWKATESPQLHYKVVDCPDAFISLISGAFSAAGPSDGSATPAPTPTPDSGDYTYGDACGADGCSDCDEGCQWSWPSNEPEGYDGSNAACRCNPDLTSVPVTSTVAPTPPPPTCEYAAQNNRAVKNRGTGGKKLKRKNYGSTAEYLADCEARCNADSRCGGFVDDPTDIRGRMCKPKKVGSVPYKKNKKTFYAKGNAC